MAPTTPVLPSTNAWREAAPFLLMYAVGAVFVLLLFSFLMRPIGKIHECEKLGGEYVASESRTQPSHCAFPPKGRR